MSTPTFSIQDALTYGWTNAKKYWKPLAVLVGANLVLGMFQNAVNPPNYTAHSASEAFLRFIFSTALQLVNVAVTIAWIRAALQVRDGKDVDLKAAFQVMPHYLVFLLAAVLFGLIVAGGMVLLIVPGLIWLAQFCLFGFAVVDEGKDPIAALKRSSALTRGAKGHVLLFLLAVWGINILGAMALIVGLFLTLPLTVLAGVDVYRQLSIREKTLAPAQPSTPLPTPTPA